MRISYELTIDDLLRMHDYYFAHSPLVKRQIFLTRVAVAALPISLGVYFYLTGQSTASLGIGLVLAVGAYFFIEKSAKATSRNQMRKMIHEGKTEGLLGEHTLELADDGFTDQTGAGQTKHRWEDVDRVASTPDDLYIFIAGTQGHIVPRSGVKDGDWSAFVSAVEKRFRESNAGSPPPQ